MQQFYVVEVRKMMVSDEGDIAASWTGVIAEADLGKVDLALSPDVIEQAIKDMPVTNLRPMTEDEIREWRNQEDH